MGRKNELGKGRLHGVLKELGRDIRVSGPVGRGTDLRIIEIEGLEYQS
jgi:hypothetical protein